MNFKTHFASGLLSGIVLYVLMPDKDIIYIMFGCAVGSILPDIDQPQSIISQALPIVAAPIQYTHIMCMELEKIARKQKNKQIEKWLDRTGKLFAHRGIFHSLFFVFVFLFFFMYLDCVFYLSVGVGCCIHILLDKAGIACNSKLEHTMYILIWILIIFAICYKFDLLC